MRHSLELSKWALELDPGGGGAFRVPGPRGPLNVIASWGGGWDHVSVSTPHRAPTWDEMEFIKRMFFKPDETVMQLHVPEAEHLNCHPNCLHLWRPQNEAIPRPPSSMVAPSMTRRHADTR